MRFWPDAHLRWRRRALTVLAALALTGASRLDAQSDVPLGVRRATDFVPTRPLRAFADVALCRTFDCGRSASGALEVAPSSRVRIAAEGATGRAVLLPASPISADARVDLFYGTATRQLWIGRSASRLRGDDSLGFGPNRWLEYGAALRFHSLSVAVDVGSGSQTPSASRRSTPQPLIQQRVDSLTGSLHVDTTVRAASSSYERIRLRSAVLRLGWESDLWKLGVVFGRAGSQVERPVSWSTVEVQRRVGRALALVANVGNYPGSMATSLPRSRWMMGVGLIAAVGRATRATPPSPVTTPTAESFVAIQVAPTRYRIVAHVPGAERVELAADFTGWEPIAMEREADDAWSAELAASRGVHRVSLRSDGGPWISPPGLLEQDDGFGGSAGVFVIP